MFWNFRHLSRTFPYQNNSFWITWYGLVGHFKLRSENFFWEYLKVHRTSSRRALLIGSLTSYFAHYCHSHNSSLKYLNSSRCGRRNKFVDDVASSCRRGLSTHYRLLAYSCNIKLQQLFFYIWYTFSFSSGIR